VAAEQLGVPLPALPLLLGAGALAATGAWVFLVLGGALGGYIGWKRAARRGFLRQLQIARVTPEDLGEGASCPYARSWVGSRDGGNGGSPFRKGLDGRDSLP
jgi:hypothetical protein